jgi:diguanylate cyclase (GGDEF)-like protein
MNRLLRWNRKTLAVIVMIGLSCGILGLGLELRSQMRHQRKFMDTELVVRVHELNQLQREILRLNQQLLIRPPVPKASLKQQIDLAQSRMTIIERRLESARWENYYGFSPATLEQERAIQGLITHWRTLKPQLELNQSPLPLANALKDLELAVNQVILRNRELQWAEYQRLLEGQVRSLNQLTLLLICFFTFAGLFAHYAVKFVETRQRLLEEMKQLSTTDELTQISNRRYFNQVLEREWNRMQRDENMIAVILIDIDYFKQYNDCYGHQAGDRCLQQVAQVLASGLRRSQEFVARYGGEEFVIVMSNVDLVQVEEVMQRLHDQLRQQGLEHQRSVVSDFVTMSMGMAIGIPSAACSPTAVLEYADAALYEAKSQGRNRSCCKYF